MPRNEAANAIVRARPGAVRLELGRDLRVLLGERQRAGLRAPVRAGDEQRALVVGELWENVGLVRPSHELDLLAAGRIRARGAQISIDRNKVERGWDRDV